MKNERGRRTTKLTELIYLFFCGAIIYMSIEIAYRGFTHWTMGGLTGYMYMHKHHAEEEFHNYLHVLGNYINEYQEIPEMAQVSAPVVELDGTTMEEKMMKGMELYQTWEMGVCAKLKAYQAELSQGKEYVDELICDVHEELKCINLMQNELLDGEYEELNCYLTKKWGD